jgi:hypothetical protein
VISDSSSQALKATTGRASLSAGNSDLGAFTLRIRLGALDEQLHPIAGQGHVFHIQPDEFGTAQRASEAEEKLRPVTGASEIRPAGPTQFADLGRGDGCCSPRRTPMLASDAAERLADRRMLGIERMAGDATRTGNGGNPTAQGSALRSLHQRPPARQRSQSYKLSGDPLLLTLIDCSLL